MCTTTTQKLHENFLFFTKRPYVLLLLLVILPKVSFCQPSGGPYGPIQQNYSIPKISGTIYYVSPEGDSTLSATTADKVTTLKHAIELVKTGDAIILRGGTYRTGNLVFNQSVTIQPYANELPIIKGSYIAENWEALRGGLWRTKWEYLFPEEPADWWRKEREGYITPLHKFNNDMVFIDGQFLQSVGWQGAITEDSYYIDYDDGYVYIGTNPADKLIEITAFNGGLIRTTNEVHGKKSDGIGPVIRGITLTQYAYRALEIEGYYPEGLSNELDHGKDVVGTTIEHCTLSNCSRVAAYLKGDNLTIRNCEVYNTSTEGLYIISSNDVLLEKNIFRRNNIEQITGYFPAVVKIFNQSYRVTCNDNLITDLPYSNGIWYDVGNVDGVFTNNWLENVGNTNEAFTGEKPWPSRSAFFFEISKGALCTGNIFVNCDHAMLILNSANVQVYNNTLVNSQACFGRDQRSAQGDHFGWHPSTGPDVEERTGHTFENNLMVADEAFKKPLLFIWQPEFMCERLKEPSLKKVDHNVYSSKGAYSPAIWINQQVENTCIHKISSLNDLQPLKLNYDTHSKLLEQYNGYLFKGYHLENYRIHQAFKEKIKTVINTKSNKPYVGAYPFD